MTSKRTATYLRAREKVYVSTFRKEGNAAAACKTYLERRKVWQAIKKEVQKKDEVLTVYSFCHRYVY